MQINVTVANDQKRASIWVEDTETLRGAFDKAAVSIGNGMIQLNGDTLGEDHLDKSFAQCGVTGRTATLSSTVKSVGN